MNKVNKTKEASLRILKNFNPALIESLKSLGYLNPSLLPFIALGQSILGYYGEMANAKTIDLLKNFYENKEKIVLEIVQSDKFKSAFIKIIGENITEGNEEKRQYLKNYIINFALGVEPNFNEHSKIINVLNNITLDEVVILKLWSEESPINLNLKYKDFHHIFTISDIKQAALDTRGQTNNNILGDFERYVFELANNKDKANQILLSLGYKDLLYVVSENNFGSGEEAKTRGTTEFGKIFLKFIK